MPLARILFVLVTTGLFLSSSWAWSSPPRFDSFGPFSVQSLSGGRYKVTDAIGRTLHLIPKGQKPPPGIPKERVVTIPVRKVAMSGGRDVSLLISLGAEDKVVAVTGRPDYWVLPFIKEGLARGSIVTLGSSLSIDYEKLAAVKPEVFFTWDESLIPMASELGVSVCLTYGDLARNLDTQIKFARFLAPFFGAWEKADEYIARIQGAISRVQMRTVGLKQKPKVVWGDIYEKRVLVEPGHSWAAEVIKLAGGDYLYNDVRGTSCLEISLERFFSSGKMADVMITYRDPGQGITSKAQLAKVNPEMALIKPVQKGEIYFPLKKYNQSGHKLDEIIEEVAAILHPELYQGYKLKYFVKLPAE
ncbi:MAG: ABC transporter substrate-binding protein [Desulfarculaceae bacterium]|jgi:iron complex transport system substrate-binding protein